MSSTSVNHFTDATRVPAGTMRRDRVAVLRAVEARRSWRRPAWLRALAGLVEGEGCGRSESARSGALHRSGVGTAERRLGPGASAARAPQSEGYPGPFGGADRSARQASPLDGRVEGGSVRSRRIESDGTGVSEGHAGELAKAELQRAADKAGRRPRRQADASRAGAAGSGCARRSARWASRPRRSARGSRSRS